MPKFDVGVWSQGAGLSYIGFFFVAAVGLFAMGGYWLDAHFHKSPLFTVLGLAIGLFAGVREMLRALKDSTARAAQRSASRGDTLRTSGAAGQSDKPTDAGPAGGNA